MATSPGTPSLDDLDSFLSTQRIVTPGVCRFCREVPDDLRALIDQRQELKAWTAFSRQLSVWGYEIKPEMIKQHYTRSNHA